MSKFAASLLIVVLMVIMLLLGLVGAFGFIAVGGRVPDSDMSRAVMQLVVIGLAEVGLGWAVMAINREAYG